MPGAYIEIYNFLENTEADQKDGEIHQKNSLFKNVFLDSKRNLKEEIHQKLERLVIPVWYHPLSNIYDTHSIKEQSVLG